MKDKRYQIAQKEAIIGIILVVINFLWWYGFAYGLGSTDPNNYRYILGMPEWFFYSCIIGFMVMSILVYISVKIFFTDVSFDEEDGSEK